MYLRQQLRAENDRNGNPRRVWILLRADEGSAYVSFVASVDEGYEGDPRSRDSNGRWADSVQLPSVDVSVSEYRRFLKWGQL